MAGPDVHTEQATIEQEAAGHGGVVLYTLIWLALVVLTTATFLVSRLDLSHRLHLISALIIASTKAALVVLFFMHLAYHRGANRLVFLTAVFFVALLIGLTVADNATRFPLANPPNPENLLQEPPIANPPRPPPRLNRLPDWPPPQGFQ